MGRQRVMQGKVASGIPVKALYSLCLGAESPVSGINGWESGGCSGERLRDLDFPAQALWDWSLLWEILNIH